MQATEQHEELTTIPRLDPKEIHELLCKRLAVVVDSDAEMEDQLAAIRDIQRDMLPHDPMRFRDPMDLLHSQKDPWMYRSVYDPKTRTMVKRPLNRPPRGIADVW